MASTRRKPETVTTIALVGSEPMKRTSITPAMFIATPCTPAGNPKRNNSRMTPQSGAAAVTPTGKETPISASAPPRLKKP